MFDLENTDSFLYDDFGIELENNEKNYASADELFSDADFHAYLQQFWPTFAAKANDLCLQNGKLGQECGKMRERALLYLFSRYLGEDIKDCPLDDFSVNVVEKGKDVVLFGRDVSIKTIGCTKGKFNQLKISWIEDKGMADELVKVWRPQFDLLLCRLKWGSNDEGIYYISRDIQNEVIEQFVNLNALKVSNGYGKGTSLSSEVCEALVSHPDVLKVSIDMPEEFRDDNFLNQLFDQLYFDVKCELDSKYIDDFLLSVLDES